MIKNTHPDYDLNIEHWNECLDAFEGPRAIKEKTTSYLSPSRGMRMDGFGVDAKSEGAQAYKAYVERAYYPSNYADTVKKILGVMHRQPAVFNLPDSMKSLITDATGSGESLQEFLRRINKKQLCTGRASILGDIQPIESGSNRMRPTVALYSEKATRQWYVYNQKTLFVILDESGPQMNDQYKYVQVKQYRVIRLIEDESGKITYATAVTRDESANIDELNYITPNVSGKTLETLPFSFVNADNTNASIQEPPLLGLKDSCIAIYRASADLNSALFLQGQETLVISGNNTFNQDDDEHVRTGTGAVINLPMGAKAEYIGVNSQGLPEMRLNLQNAYDRAQQQSSQLSVQSASNRDSAEALSIRGSNMSAHYTAIALAGAEALEQTLKAMAPWFNANPDEITVKPNLDFAQPTIDPDSFVDLIAAKNAGLKISEESIHDLMHTYGLTKNTFEQEQILLASEESLTTL